MTTYTNLTGIKQLLDVELWDEDKLDEQAITLAPQVTAWVNMQLGRTTDFTTTELNNEPIITLASNCFAVYLLTSSQLDGHSVEEVSLAMRRFDEAKDYLFAYGLRNGIVTPDAISNPQVSGCVDFAFATGTDTGCI